MFNILMKKKSVTNVSMKQIIIISEKLNFI